MQDWQQRMREVPSAFWTWFVRGLIAVVLLGVGIVGYAAWLALTAEENLIALTTATHLVSQYIETNDGRWPKSWEDLETVSALRPELQSVSRLRQFVDIDFDADPEVLAKQTPEEFRAIRQKENKRGYPTAVQQRCEMVIHTLKTARAKAAVPDNASQ